MTDSTDDYHVAEDFPLAALEDDCKLLGSMLDDCLKVEVGEELFKKVERIRALAQCAAMLAQKYDTGASRILSQRMADELVNMQLDEALPLTRACGHYLNLTSIAELHHRVRRSRVEGKGARSCEAMFATLISEGMDPEEVYEAMISQTVEVVLTAHPTQVNRRTLQFKHTKIAALLQQNDRPDLTEEEREAVLQDLLREVAGLWQTDELRRQKPTPIDEAKGGMHIVEQSLWAAVPDFMRRVSAALKKHTGKDLPLGCTPVKFASWMGGDRDGNPNVTARTTLHVSCLARWMAADLYLKEVDVLRFELSMNQCNDQLWQLAQHVVRSMDDHKDKKVKSKQQRDIRMQMRRGSIEPKFLPDGMVIGMNPFTAASEKRSAESMPGIPTELPGQDLEGGSECDFPLGDADPEGSSVGASGATTPRPGTPKPLAQLAEHKEAFSGASGFTTPKKVGRESTDVPTALGNQLQNMILETKEKGTMAPVAGVVSATNFLAARAVGCQESPGPYSMPVGASVILDPAGSAILDPTTTRKALRTARTQMDIDAYRRTHEHPGMHPYRMILSHVRQKLINTRKRMEDLLAGTEPDPNEEWYETEEELAEPLIACYWSLYECGAGIIADGRLLDLIRRVYCFGMSLLKMDLRQESTRHAKVLDEVTSFLGLGSYLSWTEDQRIDFLTTELMGRRPLVSHDMPMSPESREVMETFRVAGRLGRRHLGAYVISMTTAASDVLAVELLQREARMQVAGMCGVRPDFSQGLHVGEDGKQPDFSQGLRVVPLFETLDDLSAAEGIMRRLFNNIWYRDHLTRHHEDSQEVMLGYSDSGKDAGRLAANWALYLCQERLVALCKEYQVKLNLFHGRGGTVGRGGGPMYLAIQSQPPGSVQGKFRITEQGEMVQAKFGIHMVAVNQLEIYTTAVLTSTVKPPAAPKHKEWRDIMELISKVSCEQYRSIVFQHPHFISYFRNATPEGELGNLNIGSRPSRRKKDGGVSTLRAIPWIFAWTQTRLILPSWLGIGQALMNAIQSGKRETMQEMYEEWPFFQSTIDLIEMILAKADMRIAALYDDVLVEAPEERALGQELRQRFITTVKAVLEVTGHQRLCENNATLRHLIQMRNPYIDPINILQTEILKRLRSDPDNEKLRDALLITINGIAAGMRNTG